MNVQKYNFESKSQLIETLFGLLPVVYERAKVQF